MKDGVDDEEGGLEANVIGSGDILEDGRTNELRGLLLLLQLLVLFGE
ncbi:unnamed protein product [Schistosoma curassoni]|uniref:Uncharacterized protein n=1 Tax=Schistosoma curassoni TaxID=6186 RepID=A0A183JFT3_9TREM|nr:unnamed protein product [Schistosoma curassoni]